jgi:hypothetical protein
MSFKRLDPEDFVVSSDSITSTLWSNNVPILNSFFTSSVQEAGSSGNFYLSVYQTASNLSTAEIQLDIVYCDYLGSGSEFYNNIVPGYSPTRTMYGQYRSLILEDETQNFIFGSSANSGYNSCGVLVSSSTSIFGDRFWALSIERARYKESLFPGSCNLTLTGPGGAAGTTITSFGLNSEETPITSDYIFVRARNSEFNYSENPSFISGSTGEIYIVSFINNPQTYMTTVGLYNDSNELLAVAKLSKPLNKDFTKEALIRVKLDF